MHDNYVSPRRIRIFEDSAACLEMIDQLRWTEGHYCPRCGSRNVRSRADSSSGKSYLCGECNYAFNAAAGTIFMGARLPLASYVQAFTLHDALGESLSTKEMSFAIGSSDRAVVGVIQRVKSLRSSIKFTAIDPKLARQLGAHVETTGSAAQNFFGFCETKSIIVNQNAFVDFLKVASTTAMPDLVESYARRGRLRPQGVE